MLIQNNTRLFQDEGGGTSQEDSGKTQDYRANNQQTNSDFKCKFNLIDKVQRFQGGQISYHIREWKLITSDPNILQVIKGDKIEFIMKPPAIHTVKSPVFTEEEHAFIKTEIQKLINKHKT